MRILLIEDDPDLNNQIKASLEDGGYSVDTAVDGEEGHFLGDTEPYDAVVLDLGLPKVDGITVLEKWSVRNMASASIDVTNNNAEPCKVVQYYK